MPRDSGWNDFGYQVRATVSTLSPDGKRGLLLRAFIIVQESGGNQEIASFDKWIAGLQKDDLYELIDGKAIGGQRFVTLLADDSEYRDLAEWCESLEERKSILAVLGDINYARVTDSLPRDTIDKFIGAGAFLLGVMRSSAAYRAFMNGAKYVNQELRTKTADARTNIHVQAQLKGFRGEHRIAFEFGAAKHAKLVSDRIHVLIGKNGVGKTQILRQIVGSIALRADGANTDTFVGVSNEEFNADAVKISQLPNALIVFSADADAPFPAESRIDAPLDYYFFGLSWARRPSPMRAFESTSLSASLRNILRDESPIRKGSRFQLFREVVESVVRLNYLHLPLRENSSSVGKLNDVVMDSAGKPWFCVGNMPRGEEQQLLLAASIDAEQDAAFIDSNGRQFPPSSGQRAYLHFAAQAISVLSPGSLLVIDEPETHLHPNFVSDFMMLLHRILSTTKSVALVATHSPYVVREVPSSCVHVLSSEAGVPAVTGVYLKTLGASVSSISEAVFGDSTASRFHDEIAREFAKQAQGRVGTEKEKVAWLVQKFGDELNSEMLSKIRFEMIRGEDQAEA